LCTETFGLLKRKETAAMQTALKVNVPIRVLLVEDEFLIAEWVAESLSEQGFVVHTASNARDALRHLAAAPVDVLFTDINLPAGMDGAALARCAREMLPKLPVVYASARVAVGSDERVPGALFVPKPYEPCAVGRLIVSLVDSAKATLVPELV
jgi:two-component system, response regulator PdtaR